MALGENALGTGAVSAMVQRSVAHDLRCIAGSVCAGDDDVAFVKVAVSKISAGTTVRGLAIKLCGDLNCSCILEVGGRGDVVREGWSRRKEPAE